MASRSRGRGLVERAPYIEASLWRRLRFEAEVRCREALFQLHLPFAKRIAGGEHSKKRRLGLERGDFEQASFAALLEAIDRYDPLVGAPFQAFARVRIKGAIADGLARASEVGAQVRYRKRVQAERIRSLSAGGKVSDADALSALSELAALLAIGFIAENGVPALGSTQQPPDPFESTAWRDLEISVRREIERLPETERAVIYNHYVLGVEFTQIALLLGCTKGRVSQLHTSALKRLRSHLRRLE